MAVQGADPGGMGPPFALLMRSHYRRSATLHRACQRSRSSRRWTCRGWCPDRSSCCLAAEGAAASVQLTRERHGISSDRGLMGESLSCGPAQGETHLSGSAEQGCAHLHVHSGCAVRKWPLAWADEGTFPERARAGPEKVNGNRGPQSGVQLRAILTHLPFAG